MLFTYRTGFTTEYAEKLSNLLTDKLSGKTLEEAESDLRNCLNKDFCDNRDFVADILSTIESSVEPHGEEGIVVGGTQNIIDYPEYMSVEKARNFVALLETKDMLYNMMKKATNLEFSITIGQENEAKELFDMSVVTATYKIGGKPLGSFGVIGPTRMNYAKVMSILGYVSNSLNGILSNFIETDEDS